MMQTVGVCVEGTTVSLQTPTCLTSGHVCAVSAAWPHLVTFMYPLVLVTTGVCYTWCHLVYFMPELKDVLSHVWSSPVAKDT